MQARPLRDLMAALDWTHWGGAPRGRDIVVTVCTGPASGGRGPQAGTHVRRSSCPCRHSGLGPAAGASNPVLRSWCLRSWSRRGASEWDGAGLRRDLGQAGRPEATAEIQMKGSV